MTIEELTNILAEKILTNNHGTAGSDHHINEVMKIFPNLQFGMDLNVSVFYDDKELNRIESNRIESNRIESNRISNCGMSTADDYRYYPSYREVFCLIFNLFFLYLPMKYCS